MPDKFSVSVTFTPEKGYIGTAPELPMQVTALSLGGLRRRIQALMIPDKPQVILSLDRAARRERDQRRRGGQPGAGPR